MLNPASNIKNKYILKNSLLPVDLFSVPFFKEILNSYRK